MLIHDADGRMRCDVLIQRGFDEPRVLASSFSPEPVPAGAGIARESLRLWMSTAAATPAWSPRGTYVAVPWLDPRGLAVLRVSDGKLITSYAAATFPSWSFDEQFLALVLSGEAEGYHVTEPNFGRPLSAVPTRHASQPAVWDSTDLTFQVLAWHEDTRRGAMHPYTAELVRYDVRKGRAEALRPVISRTPPAGEDLASIFFARIPATQTLFVVAPHAGEMTDVLEMNPDRRVPAKRHIVLDPDMALGPPSTGSNKNSVALKLGSPHSDGLPAIFDRRTGETRAIVPDLAIQVHAAQVVTERILHVFEATTPKDLKNPTARLIRLPTPAALRTIALQDGRVVDRIEGLARFALRLLELKPGGIASRAQRRALLECELFNCYLLGDYPKALRVAESLEPMLESPHDRLALLLVRVQCSMGQRQWAEARKLLTLIQQRIGSPAKADRVENEQESDLFQGVLQGLFEEIAESEK